MAVEKQVEQDETSYADAGGFATLDDQGRLTLPESLRDALDLRAGSTVACFYSNGYILLMPVDSELAELMDHTADALEDAGLTSQDFLDNLDKIREEVFIETYGAEFVEDLERRFGALVGTALEPLDDQHD